MKRLAALVALLSASAAFADVFDTYGFCPRATAMAGVEMPAIGSWMIGSSIPSV